MKYFMTLFIAISVLVSAAITVVHERNQAVNYGFRIDAANKEIAVLEEDLHQLRIERAALLDPRRLGPIAVSQGLKVARPDEVVPMPLESAP